MAIYTIKKIEGINKRNKTKHSKKKLNVFKDRIVSEKDKFKFDINKLSSTIKIIKISKNKIINFRFAFILYLSSRYPKTKKHSVTKKKYIRFKLFGNINEKL